MTGKVVVVSGYATLDYVASLETPLQAGTTTLAHAGVAGAWPRAGGAALYAASRCSAAGHDAFPLTSIGKDEGGAAYLAACATAGVCTDAVARESAARTGRCLLLYNPDGGSTCVLDPGTTQALTLSSDQQAILARADHLCIAAGAPAIARQILDLCSPDLEVSWIAKLDHTCFPRDLCERIASRAKFIFCNASERAFVNDVVHLCRADRVIIQTLGAQGVLLDLPGGEQALSASPLTTMDATGAGDTLAGETIARHLLGEDISNAVAAGMAAARSLLAAR